ncbi:GNAT family N-acetyltransferase [Streptomyces sioyaensis]|uniref:GNAT family N-acetyltransferase n=1 Tax=Streptomyces sioyaensis TaxID=67364 RepID=A0A4Q1QKW6_9ACTN|nr:GNAT family N-acetyltransferase [Streptomyces sioyaensis]MBM4793061.1 GNAT family N-acetyltransferase [Streptomyces sioyaensis]RXS61833.1 GNAT family N-acetyltransferase [Streptomyces sioyaensis]
MTRTPALLRPAVPADLDALVELHTRARTAYYRAGGLPAADIDTPDGPARRREGWARSIRSATRTVRCALRDDTVVGVVAMGPPLGSGNEARTVGELYQIHVLPGQWGLGIGGQLHTAFVRFLRDAALPTGRVEAWERNDRARAFYARHGWRPDGHRRPGPAGACYVRMRLDPDAL